MNEFETTLHLMMLNHVSYEELADRMGQTGKGNLYNSLNKNKNIYVSSLLKILNAMGYDMVIRKKDGSGIEYIIGNDNSPSTLRFHDMNLNLEAVLNGTPRHSKKNKVLGMSERLTETSALRRRITELSFFDCDRELRKIWDIRDTSEKGYQPYSEYLPEYEKYRKELKELYANRERV